MLAVRAASPENTEWFYFSCSRVAGEDSGTLGLEDQGGLSLLWWSLGLGIGVAVGEMGGSGYSWA